MTASTASAILAHAAHAATSGERGGENEGWFPEYDFNGRMKSALDAMARDGRLESKKLPHVAPFHVNATKTWYRLPKRA